MNEVQHRKQLLIQRIADHRELLCRELDVLRESNPLIPVISGARRFTHLARLLRPSRLREGTSGLEPQDIELLTAALPMILQVLKLVLGRFRRRGRAPSDP